MWSQKLTIVFDRTDSMRSFTNHIICTSLNIVIESTTEEIGTAEPIGWQVYRKFNWKTNTENIILKPSQHAWGQSHESWKQETRYLAYFIYILSIMKHGIIYGISLMDVEKYFISKRKPLVQVFWNELFRKFSILPSASKYVLSVISFNVDSVEKIWTNSAMYNVRSRFARF